MQKKKRIALIWLRNDLRVSDHLGFYKASQECDQIFAYYTFDERNFKETCWGFKKSEKFRTKFLLETIRELKKELSKKYNWNLKSNHVKRLFKLVERRYQSR